MSRPLLFAAFAGLVFVALPAGSRAERPVVALADYIIEPGDTCAGIARRRYGDGERWDVVHEFNPRLGPVLPHRLVPGEVLRLPPTLPPAAWVTRIVREVEHRSAAASAWSRSVAGQPLDVGFRVATGDRSAARLSFRDDSALELRQDTLVVIFGRSAGQSDRRPNRARLERGTLMSRLAALRGEAGDGVEVSSGSAVASFGAGDALMSLDAGASAVSNHAGGSVEVASADRSSRVAVAAGMGTRVEPGRAPAKPRPLPEPPRWVDDGPGTVWAVVAEQAVAQVAWAAVPGARWYRVELDGGGSLVAGADLPPSQTSVVLTGLSAGRWSVRVSVTDGDALSSRPSAPVALTVAALPVDGAARVAVGAVIRGCGSAADPTAPEVVVEAAGRQSLRCGGEVREIVAEGGP